MTNLGTDNAGAQYYEALVSTGNSASAIYTGTSLGYASGTANVPSYTHTSMLATLPTSITPGTYYVGLYVDYGDYISETDENNNIIASSSAQLTVLDCGPDLEPTSVSGPISGVRGGTALVSVQIANVGMEDATTEVEHGRAMHGLRLPMLWEDDDWQVDLPGWRFLEVPEKN